MVKKTIRDFSIGEVAQRAGINSSTLRYYEKIDLLPKPPRRSGRRQYDESILDRLKIIQIAKSFDFTLEEIAVLLEGFSETKPPGELWRTLANAKLVAIEQQIERARQLHYILTTGLTCKCLKLSECTLPQIGITKQSPSPTR